MNIIDVIWTLLNIDPSLSFYFLEEDINLVCSSMFVS